jgi:short-subunit dehydrogenase
VFGNIDVTVAFLPYMRERKSGTIIQLGSRIVWTPEMPGISLYASSKAAVHTFSETLACEVAPFNINVLIFEPGGFRSRGTIEGGIDTSNPIPDYNDTRENMLEMRNRASEVFRGDPRKLMEFLVDVIKSEGKAEGKPLPKYLVCGPGANEGLLGKCEIMRNAVDEWRWVTKELLLDSP